MPIQIDHALAEEILLEESALASEYPEGRDISNEEEWKVRVDKLGELCPYRKSSTFVAALGVAMLAKSVDARVDVYCILERDGGEHSYSARSLADGVWARHRAYLEVDLGANGPNPLNNTPFVGRARIDEIENVRNKLGYKYLRECLDHLAEINTEGDSRTALRAFVRSRRVRRIKAFECGENAGDHLTASTLPLLIKSFVDEDSEEGRRAQACAAGLLSGAFGSENVDVGHINDPDRNLPLDVIVFENSNEEVVRLAVEVKDKPVSGAEILGAVDKANAQGVWNVAYLAVANSQTSVDYSNESEIARDLGCRLTCFFDWRSFANMVIAVSPGFGPRLFSDVYAEIGHRLVGIGGSQAAIERWQEYANSTE